jgi:hypothetical protein
MDPDHRLLLRSSQGLLTSRNSGVIMAVVQIYECCAPPNELGIIVKPLTRLLRGHREVQNVALITIASLVSSESRRIAFEPFIKTFFIRGDDPGFIRQIKLEILTCLASDSTIGIILREFQMCVLVCRCVALGLHLCGSSLHLLTRSHLGLLGTSPTSISSLRARRSNASAALLRSWST